MAKSIWKIRFTKTAEKQGRKLSSDIQTRIDNFLVNRLAASDNPRNLGEALIGHWSGYIRYRVGDYRIICKIEDETITILVIEIGHRREIYR
jgi:mRNA interferase RelE/StbE